MEMIVGSAFTSAVEMHNAVRNSKLETDSNVAGAHVVGVSPPGYIACQSLGSGFITADFPGAVPPPKSCASLRAEVMCSSLF